MTSCVVVYRDSSSLACRNSYCVHHNVSNSFFPLTVFCTRYEIPQFLVYIISFERILKSRLENSEKLGKDLFNYDLSSGSRKNTFTGLKTPQNCLFSSHLFIRQSWTKVLGHFCISGAFSNSHRSNPSPHPTNNVGRVYPEFFSEIQLCIGWVEGELQENFENAALGTEK